MKCRTLLLQRLYLPLPAASPRNRLLRNPSRKDQNPLHPSPHTEVCSGKASGAQGGSAGSPRSPVRNGRPGSQRQKKQEPKPEKVFTPAAPGSIEEKIESFLKGLFGAYGFHRCPHAWKNEESEIYQVELIGKDLGMLIGRRGETLDAIQHLTNYAVNRNCEGRVRISVDAEDYRVKREESLRRYARKKAQQVLKQRRRTTLEPMNAYERHVIPRCLTGNGQHYHLLHRHRTQPPGNH